MHGTVLLQLCCSCPLQWLPADTAIVTVCNGSAASSAHGRSTQMSPSLVNAASTAADDVAPAAPCTSLSASSARNTLRSAVVMRLPTVRCPHSDTGGHGSADACGVLDVAYGDGGKVKGRHVAARVRFRGSGTGVAVPLPLGIAAEVLAPVKCNRDCLLAVLDRRGWRETPCAAAAG